jgi:hypothetical protein
MTTFAVMTHGFLSFVPILKVYYTEITAIVIGILFHIFQQYFRKQRRTQVQYYEVSMIVIGIALAYFI